MDTLRTSPCNLCPRMCGARRDEGARGACGASSDILVARAALHFWEEPPLSGNAGSGAVFFAHCPLHCVYCQNYEIATKASHGTFPAGNRSAHGPFPAGNRLGTESSPRISSPRETGFSQKLAAALSPREIGRVVDVSRLAEICLELQGQGALNVNFVTPTHYSLDVMRAVGAARSRGLAVPVVWNTSGYEREEAVHALAGTVDVWLADFKYADGGLARRYSSAPDYPEVSLAAIAAMVEAAGRPQFDEVDGMPRMTRGVIVRHLALPGALDQSKRALRLLHSRFADDVLYSIMNQYTPVMSQRALKRFPELGARVPDSEYEGLLDFADALGMEDYFWQEGPAAEESFIPAWDGTGV